MTERVVEGPVTEAGREEWTCRDCGRVFLEGVDLARHECEQMASRALWDEYYVARHSKDGERIFAAKAVIEAAARAEVIAEIRAGVEGLHRNQYTVGMALTAPMVAYYSVLALLPPTEPK